MTKLASFFLGTIISFLLLGIPYLAKEGYFKPVPYRVTAVEHSRVGDKTNIKINFIKDGCEWDRMAAIGRYFDEVFFLEFDVAAEGDRLEGDYTINVLVDDSDKPYSSLELRTRHLCGADDPSTPQDERETVDRVLARVNLDYNKDVN